MRALAKQGGRFYSFAHGHLRCGPTGRAHFPRGLGTLYGKRDELVAKFGECPADGDMIEKSRNLCIYPNVY